MIVATFPDEKRLMDAVALLRARRVGEVETYTPTELEDPPIHSVMPLVILVCGVIGVAGSFFLQAYATTINYPLNIGGRPNLSWPAYIPTTFEMGVLAAVLGGFFGFFIINRLPRLYEPIDETQAMRRASRDRYVLAIRKPDRVRAHEVLAGLHPMAVEEVRE
jgi:hypothetical protein